MQRRATDPHADCPQGVHEEFISAPPHTTPVATAAITYAGRAIGAFNEFAADPQKAVAENPCG
ncbi:MULTISPECIES: hypothetical protein [unclassified Methylibium]|uniref:hypothetical protein n=1 Tax=unclassified Methylibium TaxID=2633235 RepID=UPI0003F440C7|nr:MULTISPECIES: hypothetical protein [unclassified Methylibium]EWS54144.1 hypothetical protein X551_03048 [Methylibium sp. T29]EWS58487.1 hypothetical protein Y694_03642 [Methylibium sp. T29-B]